MYGEIAGSSPARDSRGKHSGGEDPRYVCARDDKGAKDDKDARGDKRCKDMIKVQGMIKVQVIKVQGMNVQGMKVQVMKVQGMKVDEGARYKGGQGFLYGNF